MKISELIEELNHARDKYGDVEVTVTAAHLPDGYFTAHKNLPDIFESTCENVIFHDKSAGSFGKNRVRLYF